MKSVSIEWKISPSEGRVEVRNGNLHSLTISKGEGQINKETFTFTQNIGGCLDIVIDKANLTCSADPTAVTLRSEKGSFSFLLRDVSSKYPILIPEYGVMVTQPDDARSYDQIKAEIQDKGLQTVLQHVENEPEENYEESAARNRRIHCPTWLGLSRDMRIFETDFVNSFSFTIKPLFCAQPVTITYGDDTRQLHYSFSVGRGAGCSENYTRRLEDGVLPILHGELVDDDITYNLTTFTTLETSKLTSKSLRGTYFLVADGYGRGNMLTEKQAKEREALLPQEIDREEEVVLYTRVEAVNTADVPRYAWFKNVHPATKVIFSYDATNGQGILDEDGVISISRLNGEPMPKEEAAILLKPDETAVLEMFIPHRYISRERAAELAKQDFDVRHAECKKFWQEKLASAAKVSVPEKRIEEMIQAGLLHLDLITYGLEPDAPVAPFIGVYCPIGSESSPIMQFMDSIGCHRLAERSLQYFLEKQHEDGFMQNFGGYMLETGAALWSMGEHYRYTGDDAWVKRIEPKLLKSCEYLLEWRKRNQRDELLGRGYGLLDGKVADPEDPYHIFMLNGYACLGLSRVAEMISDINPAESKRLANEAEIFKQDIRATLIEAMVKSPVVPLGDGTWCPSAPAWAEADGPACLLTDEANWFSHGTVGTRDSLLGPLYLVFQEVIEPDEDAGKWLLSYMTDLLQMRNAAFSQPYYSPHPNIHLRLGQVKPFLRAYYNNFTGLADRETYTFAEHLYFVSNHKTHEEGWFLMQTRWMLYMEQGKTLKLLPGIPRVWLENGKRIELDNVATYFGPMSLRVESALGQGCIKAEVECNSSRKPERIGIRLPHPEGKKVVEAIGGIYDASAETVWIEPFNGHAEVMLRF